jgi:hypothetical protein
MEEAEEVLVLLVAQHQAAGGRAGVLLVRLENRIATEVWILLLVNLVEAEEDLDLQVLGPNQQQLLVMVEAVVVQGIGAKKAQALVLLTAAAVVVAVEAPVYLAKPVEAE